MRHLLVLHLKQIDKSESMKRYLLKKGLFIVAAVLGAILMVYWLVIFCLNTHLRNKFRPSDKLSEQAYIHAIPMEEIQFDQFSFSDTTIGVDESNILVLPVDLHYYSLKDGRKELVLTIPKGSTVIIGDELNPFQSSPGYGFHSFPTYDRGWRYAFPFQKENDENSENRMLYIRLSELKKASETMVRESRYMQDQARINGKSNKEIRDQYLLSYDWVFYVKGICCSKDLLFPWGFRVSRHLVGH